jgi:dolichol-phosphate mannosyltransferase
MTTLAEKILRIRGPILVLGASGFVGANLMRTLIQVREDVHGTTTRKPAWRLEDLPDDRVRMADLLVDSNLDRLLDDVRPRTVFDCVAYGAYSFEVDAPLIYRTNFDLVTRLLPRLERLGIACYVHAGSSSEYGDNAAGPAEDAPPSPNSDYAVSKLAAAHLIHYYGKRKQFPCANLRLYSVYGPFEDSARLIPNLIRRGVEGAYPEFVNPAIARDYIYVDDVTEAFVDTAINLTRDHHGESFNIGTGRQTTIGQVAETARALFGISEGPRFTMPERAWDVQAWYADPDKARTLLGWESRTGFVEGLERTVAWYRGLPDPTRYHQVSKKFGLDTVYSVSVVVACSDHGASIPALFERLKATFVKLNVDFEFVFVDDGSADDTEEVIRALSRDDRRVTGIGHSRRFGPQASFRSGMEVASKNACVLISGGLEDPPELIEAFVGRWREGFEVVYGLRSEPEAGTFARAANAAFYRVFNRFSTIRIPADAGDFCLLDRRVARSMLRFPERDLFLRGLRAFAGFKQVGVPYQAGPRGRERLLGRFGRAKDGILSFSNVPLTILSLVGTALLGIGLILAVAQVVVRLLLPGRSASGITTVLLFVLFFGALNAFAVGLIGEYVGRIFEEVKRRPHFIRRAFVSEGEVRRAAEHLVAKEG